MNDDDSEDKKHTGFKISNLANGLEEKDVVDGRFIADLKALSSEGDALRVHLAAVNSPRVIEDAVKISKSFQEAMRSSEMLSLTKSLGSIHDSRGISELVASSERIRSALPDSRFYEATFANLDGYASQISAVRSSMASLAAYPDSWHDLGHFSALARQAEEVFKQSALQFEDISSLADAHIRTLDSIQESMRSFTIPRLDLMGSLGIARLADALGGVNIFESLGLASDYDAQLRSITSSLGAHVEALNATQAMRDSLFKPGLTEAIEHLLARSLEAQEAMLADYRESSADAKLEASFHRRIALIATIINILMLFMTMAVNLEDMIVDSDVAIRENTEVVRQMRNSFDEMAAELRRYNESREVADANESAADAAIVDLLGEISDSLRAQTDAGLVKGDSSSEDE